MPSRPITLLVSSEDRYHRPLKPILPQIIVIEEFNVDKSLARGIYSESSMSEY